MLLPIVHLALNLNIRHIHYNLSLLLNEMSTVHLSQNSTAEKTSSKKLQLAIKLVVIKDYESAFDAVAKIYTAILRKVVGKSARDNPERYCG